MELGEKRQLGVEWIPGAQGFEGKEVALLTYSLVFVKKRVNTMLSNQWDMDWKQSSKGGVHQQTVTFS